jgi:translation initiation factor 1
MEFMKKKIDFRPAIVFSTDPNFSTEPEKENVITPAAKEQLLRITLETKHRAGKTVTLVMGFVGTEIDLAELGKKLKNFCGAGGSAKDGEIIIQGDHREKVRGWLQKNQYRIK